MTSETPPTAREPDREVDSQTRRGIHNMTLSSVKGVRQKSLRRVIVLEAVARYDYRSEGPVYRRWIEQKEENVSDSLMSLPDSTDPSDFDNLATSAGELFRESDVEFLTGISDRTAWDYLKTIRHFYVL